MKESSFSMFLGALAAAVGGLHCDLFADLRDSGSGVHFFDCEARAKDRVRGSSGAETGCDDPLKIELPGGKVSGYLCCADGTVVREEALPVKAGKKWDRCASDEDCGKHKACVPAELLEDGAYNSCVPATCRSNADCASGRCGLARYHNGCDFEGALDCRTEADRCRINADCRSQAGHESSYCVSGASWADQAGSGEEELIPEAWGCYYTASCAEGRPFAVDGQLRFATAHASDEWVHPSAVPPALLRFPQRKVLGDYWLQVAAMEHASVASFARFTLHLLQHAAPPDLLHAAISAMDDEVYHAQLAYQLASSYLGREFGPSALDTSDSYSAVTRFELAAALVREACIGETLAAALACAKRDHARDPVVVAALTRIADDETKHAALGWRALRWACAGLSSQEKRQLAVVFRESLRDLEGVDGIEPSSQSLLAFGMLGPNARAEICRRVTAQAIVPLAQQVLDAAWQSRAA